MTQQKTDRLVEDYLGAVSYACADLPPQRREELLEDLREHITAARAVLYEPTEAAIRTILDRLGEPSAIADEALLAEPRFLREPTRRTSDQQSSEACLPLSGWLSRPRGPAVASRPSTATLGMVLGFVLIIVVVIVAGTVLMYSR